VPEVPEVPEVSPPEVPPLPPFDEFDLEQPMTKPTMTVARSITGYRIKNVLGRKPTSLKDHLAVPLNERQFKSTKGIAQANGTVPSYLAPRPMQFFDTALILILETNTRKEL
jgi:hypothetical protein